MPNYKMILYLPRQNSYHHPNPLLVPEREFADLFVVLPNDMVEIVQDHGWCDTCELEGYYSLRNVYGLWTNVVGDCSNLNITVTGIYHMHR